MSRPFRHRIRVRYAECDPQGVVFNAHYVAYLDIAMTELWRESVPGGYDAMLEEGTDMVVGEVSLRFRSPARFDDEIDLEPTITRLGTTGMTTAVRILRAEEVLAEAQIRHVFVDVAGGGKTPIPDAVREALAGHLAPEAAT